jgi:glycosyltransferase involved in cell wall biosynthesis
MGMKVLMTTDNIGGVWTFTLNLARGLRDKGAEVLLAVIGETVSESQKQELEPFEWKFFNSKQEWMPEPWEDIDRAGEWLLGLRNSFSPDLVHLNSYSFGSLQWNSPVVITAHSCVLSWWRAVKNETAGEEWDVYRNRVGSGIRSASLVVAPSHAMMDSVDELYGPSSKTVIYNGAEASKYHMAPTEEIIFSMGRLWDESKNIGLVLEAATKINHPVYVAGNYERGDFNIPPNVHMLGYLDADEVAGWLSRSAIYLLPVRYEPFGYTFLEAAMSGCAIITGDIPSMREIWAEAAVFVDPDDSVKLALTVNSLMADSEYRQHLSGIARRKAVSDYSASEMTRNYMDVYRRTMGLYTESNYKLQEQ